MIDPGDIVIAANPSYFVYTGTLSSLSANVLTVPMDDDGMQVDAVERLLERLEDEDRLHKVKLDLLHELLPNPDRPDPSAAPQAKVARDRQAVQQEPSHPDPGGRRVPRAEV